MAHAVSDEKARDAGMPDGAKPGDELGTPRSGYGFNADEKAAEREGADIIIGARTYRRRRKNWTVTRALRVLLRRQERAGNKVDRLSARIDALTEEIRGVRNDEGTGWVRAPLDDEDRIAAIDEQVEDLEDQIAQATDDSDDAAYEIIDLLLRVPDGPADTAPEGPGVDFLKEHLDVQDAGALAGTLTSGGEPDPTPTATSS